MVTDDTVSDRCASGENGGRGRVESSVSKYTLKGD